MESHLVLCFVLHNSKCSHMQPIEILMSRYWSIGQGLINWDKLKYFHIFPPSRLISKRRQNLFPLCLFFFFFNSPHLLYLWSFWSHRNLSELCWIGYCFLDWIWHFLDPRSLRKRDRNWLLFVKHEQEKHCGAETGRLLLKRWEMAFLWVLR